MSSWDQLLAPAASADNKKRKGEDGTNPSEAALLRELTVVTCKLGLKTALEAARVAATCYRTYRVPTESDEYKATKRAIQVHADRTRGRSGHKEGGPDPFAFFGLVRVLQARANPQQSERLAQLQTAFPPGLDVQMFVPVCVTQKCHDAKFKKIFIKLQAVPNKIGDVDVRAVEDIVHLLMTAKPSITYLPGMCPRGSLERRAQEILNLLGEASDKPAPEVFE